MDHDNKTRAPWELTDEEVHARAPNAMTRANVAAVTPPKPASEEDRRRFVEQLRALDKSPVIPCAGPSEAESLLVALLRKNPVGAWSGDGVVTCWHCGAPDGRCAPGCPHGDARHYAAYRGLLPVTE